MVRWETFERQAPDLASFAWHRLDRQVAYLATLRRDGGPRVNPVGPWIAGGRLCIRMYPDSVKVRALERDARYALHSTVSDLEGTEGEVLVWGDAHRIEDPAVLASVNAGKSNPGRFVVFEFELELVLVTTYEGDETAQRRWRSPAQ